MPNAEDTLLFPFIQPDTLLQIHEQWFVRQQQGNRGFFYLSFTDIVKVAGSLMVTERLS